MSTLSSCWMDTQKFITTTPIATKSEVRASILVVDDLPDNLRVLAAILSTEGYKVRKAMSGEMALETVRSQLPDLILLDIKMPKMDGYTVCSSLKAAAETRDIPIIFLSALDETADKVKGFAVGGADYITKPFQAEEVLVRIGHQLTIQRQQQQLKVQNQQLQREIQERQRAEALLQELNAVLEERIWERTAQVRQALEFESHLKHITDKVRDSLDEQQILQTAVEELAVGLQVECCNTGVYDAELKTSSIAHEYRTSGSSTIGRTIQIDAAGLYQPLLQRQVIQFCWYPEEGTSNSELGARENDMGTRGEGDSANCGELSASPRLPLSVSSTNSSEKYAVLACPIFDDCGILGDLWLFKPNAEFFEELEVRLVLQVTNQCAIAIRQARLYQAAQAQVTELEKLNRLKDDFLSTVSHELRTPIANIKMAIQMLEISLSKLSNSLGALSQPEGLLSQFTQYFKILKEECGRELSLIQDLLDLQYLNAGTHYLEPTTVELHDWIPHIIEPFEARARSQQQTLQVHLTPDLPLLSIDLSSLTRILTELVNNACKYTPPNETITIAARVEAGLLYLSVSNSGVEISTQELSRIFEKFYRIPESDRWKHGGTGLGLALVKGLIENLGGSIEVTSTNNLTCFTVKLPMVHGS
jgi:signal transduction histidine kinase/DNA-binding response OmpR family regulator